MIKLISSDPQAPLRRLTLGRAVAGIALLGALTLWLWALPALVMRDGFILRGSDVCAQAAYRDPVIGQSRPAPATHDTVRRLCATSTPGARP